MAIQVIIITRALKNVLANFATLCRFLFLTGRLAPQYDYFRCVVNIPDDAVRVGDPSEIDGEQVSITMSGSALKIHSNLPLSLEVERDGWCDEQDVRSRNHGGQG